MGNGGGIQGARLRRVRPLGRSAALGATLGAVSACLLLVTSAALAATPHRVVTPPYKNSVASPSYYWTASGCGKVHFAATPHWKAGSGLAAWVVTTRAPSCPGAPVNGVTKPNSASSNEQLFISIPLRLPGGSHSIGVNWSFQFQYISVLTIGATCPAPVINSYGYGSSYCYADTSLSFGAYTNLVDLTTGNYYWANNYFPGLYNFTSQSNDTYCYSGNCSYYNSSSGAPGTTSFSTSFGWWINSTFNHSHRYALSLQLYSYVDSYEYGYPKSLAAASLNFAPPVGGGKLTSISIS